MAPFEGEIIFISDILGTITIIIVNIHFGIKKYSILWVDIRDFVLISDEDVIVLVLEG